MRFKGRIIIEAGISFYFVCNSLKTFSIIFTFMFCLNDILCLFLLWLVVEIKRTFKKLTNCWWAILKSTDIPALWSSNVLGDCAILIKTYQIGKTLSTEKVCLSVYQKKLHHSNQRYHNSLSQTIWSSLLFFLCITVLFFFCNFSIKKIKKYI